MKKTSLPSVPVCQPITASLTPRPEPEYHPMKLESIRTSPATQVARSPAAQIPSAAGRYPASGGDDDPDDGGSRKTSDPSTGGSMGETSDAQSGISCRVRARSSPGSSTRPLYMT